MKIHARYQGVSRRALLGTGALGFAAGYLPSLNRRAHAAEPTRLVIVTTDHQMLPDLLPPAGQNFASVADGDLAGILTPLAPYKDKVTVVSRMSMLTAIDSDYHNNHNTAHTNLLTGAGPVGGEFAKGGPSIDQIIARGLEAPGPVRSIELGSPRKWAGGFVALAKGTNAPLIEDAKAIHAKLFSGVSLGGSVEPSKEALVTAARGDALELARKRYEAVKTKVSGEDRTKLEQHLDFLSDYRGRFGKASTVSCDQVSAGSTSGLTARTNEWARLVSHAMACGVTRVATMQLQIGPSDYGSSGDLHQDHAHNGGNATNIAQFRKFNLRGAEAFAAIVSAFASRQLLDSTLLVWVTEHGVHADAHKLTDTHAVMVGNLNGYFKTGSHIALPVATKPSGLKASGAVGVPHNHFMVSLARGMGVNIDTVNLAQHGGVSLKGELMQIKA